MLRPSHGDSRTTPPGLSVVGEEKKEMEGKIV